MQIDLLNAFARDDQVLNYSAVLESDTVSNGFGEFQILEKRPVELVINHTKNRRITLEGSTFLTLGIPCDRCLKATEVAFEIQFRKMIDFNSLEADADEKQEIGNFITGYDLDVDRLIYNEILVNWPMKVLCQESCKGICRKCGKDLNEGSCGCDQTELDPRMAAIRDIFYEHYKEV